jgi:hypothetical protein
MVSDKRNLFAIELVPLAANDRESRRQQCRPSGRGMMRG